MKTSHCETDETDPFDDRGVTVESDVSIETFESTVSLDTVGSDVLASAVESDPVREPDPLESDLFVASFAGSAVVVDVASIVSPEDVSVRTMDPLERWSDPLTSPPLDTVASDAEPAVQCEPASEMYYTASSEVSLLSDTEIPERANVDEESLDGKESKDDRKECVIAGHVAAMRERFESMTRTNTPCPDLMRSSSPSLDVFRNITPSPDRLG